MIRKNKIKRRNSRFKKKLLVGLFLFIFLGISVGTVFVGFYLNASYFINPLSKNRITKKDSIENLLKKINFNYEKIEKISNYYMVKTKEGRIIYFSSDKDLNRQASSLQVIINRLTIEGKQFKKIDFRFDKPYISY